MLKFVIFGVLGFLATVAYTGLDWAPMKGVQLPSAASQLQAGNITSEQIKQAVTLSKEQAKKMHEWAIKNTPEISDELKAFIAEQKALAEQSKDQ